MQNISIVVSGMHGAYLTFSNLSWQVLNEGYLTVLLSVYQLTFELKDLAETIYFRETSNTFFYIS